VLGTLSALAARVGGTARGSGEIALARIAAIDDAGPDALTFATSASYLQAALKSRAGAILVDAGLADQAGDAKPIIAVPDVRVALMQLLRAFARPRKRGPYRDPSAAVDPTAAIGENVYVGAHAVIGARSRVGDGTVLEAGSYVGDDAVIGSGTLLCAQARVLDGCVLGDRVVLQPGATIGSEGFGYVFAEGSFERIPQVGNVVLEDDVEIGANTCVDRAQTGSTRIGAGTKIDNLVQVGHNCTIGKNTVVAAQAGFAGSTDVGDYVQIGGQSGTRGHLRIGSRVKIAGQSGVWGDVPDDAFISGNPARPHKDELRREVMVRNLPKLVARVEALERKQA
jgi:UDP-3-O-[3-hydroxymyristoyl] glucosamine N-acyltransferase